MNDPMSQVIPLPPSDLTHDPAGIRAGARVLGRLACSVYPGQSWEALEPQIAREWRGIRGSGEVAWAEVRDEAHAAWQVGKLEAGGQMVDNRPVTDER